jgi:hypothetical protein
MSLRRSGIILCRLVLIYLSWLAMLAVHELGHVLHAWLSGGRVAAASVPLFGFSHTLVNPNPHPLFVAIGGPLWGISLPLLAFAKTVRSRNSDLVRFFVGLCLIANGAYMALGWMGRAGDAADMRKLGVPVVLLLSYGIPSLAAGLWIWHRCSWLSKVTIKRESRLPSGQRLQ